MIKEVFLHEQVLIGEVEIILNLKERKLNLDVRKKFFFPQRLVSTGNFLFHDSQIILFLEKMHRKIKQVLSINILLIQIDKHIQSRNYTYPTLYVVTFSHFHFSNNIYSIYSVVK